MSDDVTYADMREHLNEEEMTFVVCMQCRKYISGAWMQRYRDLMNKVAIAKANRVPTNEVWFLDNTGNVVGKVVNLETDNTQQKSDLVKKSL